MISLKILRFTPPSIFRVNSKRSIVFKSAYPFKSPPRISFSELLLERLWHHGSRNPAKAAMINAYCPSEKLTFKEVYLRSLSVATFLHQNDFHHGHVVATVLPNLIEFPAILIGTGLAGGSTTPASALLGPMELETQFKDSGASIVFCIDQVLENVLRAAENCPQIQKIVYLTSGDKMRLLKTHLSRSVIDFEEVKNTQPEFHWRQLERNLEKDVFVLPYSSGTTGPPKGVELSDTNLTIMLTNFSSVFESRILPHIFRGETTTKPQPTFLSFNHALGLGVILMNLYLGISTSVIPKFNFDKLCQVIQESRTRLLFVVPPVLLALANDPAVGRYDLSSLEYVISAAAPLDKELMGAVHRRLPNLRRIQQAYGMTETAFLSHSNTPDENYPYNSVGKLMPGFEMKVVDPESQEELETNEKGEIWLRSPQIMEGYRNRPESTADMLSDEGWLRTGDIGYVDGEGYTYIIDRIKELIKVKGMQVAPAELEALLLTHPKIKDCAVVGIPDAQCGEVPRAFVVATDDDVTEDEIKAFIEGSVAHYKRLKGGVVFVNEIPKSPSGKILRRLLRDEREPEKAKISLSQ